MAKCWRCGGGKTVTHTTTGTHVLPCPTCAGSGELSQAQEDIRSKIEYFQRPELEPLATAKPLVADLTRTGSKVA
jgi:hypothetical protein